MEQSTQTEKFSHIQNDLYIQPGQKRLHCDQKLHLTVKTTIYKYQKVFPPVRLQKKQPLHIYHISAQKNDTPFYQCMNQRTNNDYGDLPTNT